jgi:L-amino acid N-acyltransferase YncA
MNKDVQIRIAVPSDGRSITEMWLECLQLGGYTTLPCSAEALSAFAQRIENPQGDSCIWVAIAGDEILGWQGLIDFGVTQITRSALSSTYVSPRWHHKKVGYQLLKHAMQCAADSAFDYVFGWIKSDNTASIRLVCSLGWKLVGRVPRCRETDPDLSYYAYAVPKTEPM